MEGMQTAQLLDPFRFRMQINLPTAHSLPAYAINRLWIYVYVIWCCYIISSASGLLQIHVGLFMQNTIEVKYYKVHNMYTRIDIETKFLFSLLGV